MVFYRFISILGYIFGIKWIFTVLYRYFLSYRPTSIYRLEIDKGDTPFIARRYGKNVDKNVDNLPFLISVSVFAGTWFHHKNFTFQIIEILSSHPVSIFILCQENIFTSFFIGHKWQNEPVIVKMVRAYVPCLVLLETRQD